MSTIDDSIRNNLEFILSHFEGQHELFPRTIMTSRNQGQILIEYDSNQQKCRDRILDYFIKSNFIDCKINAFPYNTEYKGLEFEVRNRTATTFIMIDIDLRDFENKDKLEKQLNKTIKKIFIAFHEAHPTVLWTGNGYHIYQPVNGIVFEKQNEFYKFLPYLGGRDLTTEFLRFSEKFFTNGQSDPKHLPSIKSCLIRIPGTINSKNGEEVRILQKWDGKTPNIQWITRNFLIHLIQKRINSINDNERRNKKKVSHHSFLDKSNNRRSISWIESLLGSSIEDNRKYCLWGILCPYLLNVKNLTDKEAYRILIEWLQKCNQIRKLDFNPDMYIKNDLKNVRQFLPPSKQKLKKEHSQLYKMLKSKNIVI